MPFGRSVREYTFLEIYICIWIYAPNNLGNISRLNIYVGIEYIMTTLGDACKLESFCALRAQGCEIYIFRNIYMLVLDISCQHVGMHVREGWRLQNG